MCRINCTPENEVNDVDVKRNSTDVKQANATAKKGANMDANGGEREGRTHSPHLICAREGGGVRAADAIEVRGTEWKWL